MMMTKGEGGKEFENICRSIISNICKSNSLLISDKNSFLEFPKPGGGKHSVDIEIRSEKNPDIRGLFSCKYQKKKGTSDEKIAYEVIKLLSAMKLDNRYKHSWIALGGDGWSESIKGFISNGHIQEWIPQIKGRLTFFMDPNDLMARAKEEIKLIN